MIYHHGAKHVENICQPLLLIIQWLVGNGIINADGELWKIQRKAGLRFFNAANLKSFIDYVLPPLLDDTRRTLEDAAREGTQVDMQSVLLELTTRFMGNVAYDVGL